MLELCKWIPSLLFHMHMCTCDMCMYANVLLSAIGLIALDWGALSLHIADQVASCTACGLSSTARSDLCIQSQEKSLSTIWCPPLKKMK